MLPALLLAPTADHAVLDMCAAPGSKTQQLVEMVEEDAAAARDSGDPAAPGGGTGRGRSGFVVANDASLDRTISLTHRLTSVNAASPYALVTSLDGRYWPGLQGLSFDRVLVDVRPASPRTRAKWESRPHASRRAAAESSLVAGALLW